MLIALLLLVKATSHLVGDEQSQGALAQYVAQQDSSYSWNMRRDGVMGAANYAELILTSQTWRNIVWRHQLFIIKPSNCTDKTTHALLFITGGRWKDDLEGSAPDDTLPRDVRLFGSLAEKLATPIAVLLQVPHQPMFEGKYEDAIIAFTFEKFHETGDVQWPLLLPMVNSAVRAMDATQEFARQQWTHPITTFTVSGASKRGWTTWLTGAIDKRAVAIAPMVIDMLNISEHIKHQRHSWGEYSQQISDYTERKLHEKIDSSRGRLLQNIVDPFRYRQHLQQPKLIMIGTNDPYWPLDSLNLYWNDLLGEKYILYVPNTGHDLNDSARVIGSLNALHQRAAHGERLPKLAWQFTPTASDSAVSLCIQSDVQPHRVQFWTARSADRDFRRARWQPTEAQAAVEGKYDHLLPRPASGYAALFGEAVYHGRSLPFFLSTNVKIVAAVKQAHTQP